MPYVRQKTRIFIEANNLSTPDLSLACTQTLQGERKESLLTQPINVQRTVWEGEQSAETYELAMSLRPPGDGKLSAGGRQGAIFPPL